jgi:hypothetical protein
MAEWGSARTFAQRMANLSGTGTGTGDNGTVFLTTGNRGTVSDDDAADSLSGGTGSDWFFGSVAKKGNSPLDTRPGFDATGEGDVWTEI